MLNQIELPLSKEFLNNTKKLSKDFKWKIFVFNEFITIVGAIILILYTPNTFVYGYTWIDVLSMIITLAITTFMVVYSGIYNLFLFD